MARKSKEVRGVSYGRISTLGQMKDSDGFIKDDASPQVQKQKCDAYIKNYNSYKGTNYKISEHLSDEGFSGGNTKRPNYQKLERLVREKKIKFIVASELSRLSRNVMDFLAFLALCEKSDVELMIIDLNLNTSDPMGKFVTTVLIAMAAFERQLTGKRVSDNARSRLVTDGKINGSSEILGLDKCPKRRGHFIANKDELKRVVEIFNIYLRVSSKQETLDEIKVRGIKDKKDRELTLARLNKIFENAHYRYRGLWALNMKNKKVDQDELSSEKRFQLIELPHGPLIDIELLDAVLDKLEKNYAHRKKKRKDHVYLLSHLIKYEDGSGFTGQPAKQRQYRYYYNKTNDVRIRCDEFDKIIVRRMKELLKNSELFKSLIAEGQKKKVSKLPAINKDIREVKSKIEDLDTLETELQNSLLDPDERKGQGLLEFLESRLGKINQERDKLDAQMSEALGLREELAKPLRIDNIKLTIEKLLKGFYKLTGTQKRRMVEQIFEKIVINKDNSINLHIYDDICSDRKDSTPAAALLLDRVNKVKRRSDTLPTRMEKEFIEKSMTLRQIAEKHNCSRVLVRNILSDKVDNFDASQNVIKKLDQKVIDSIKESKSEGKSFADIANNLNMIGVKTKTEKGQWHPKTVRDVYLNTQLGEGA